MRDKALRFAVGDPNGVHSSIWRAWGNKKGDFYVNVRSMAGKVKASFHKDGKCQVGFTEEYWSVASQKYDKQIRHWETWKLPSEKVTRVLEIWIPGKELREFNPKQTARTIWLAGVQEDKLCVISLIICPPNSELGGQIPPFMKALGVMRTDLRDAWLFATVQDIDDSLEKIINTERVKLRNMKHLTEIVSGTRAMLWNSRSDHKRCVLELACD